MKTEYNQEQKAWRENILSYLISMQEFKENLLKGEITTDLLEEWGVEVIHKEDQAIFDIVENADQYS